MPQHRTHQDMITLFLTTLSLLFCRPGYCHESSMLVVPVDGSHWINMEVILRELHSRGHSITVLRSTKSWYIPEYSPFYTSINVRMMEDEVDRNFYNKLMQRIMMHRQLPAFIRSFRQQFELTSMLEKGNKICARAIAAMLDDPVLMKKLQDAKYDLMLTDPGLPIGVFLGSYLQLPMVFNVRWINNGESHFTMAPSPVSYVPVSGTEFTDQMDFLERTRNVLHYLYSMLEHYFFINPCYSNVLKRHFPPGADMLAMQRSAEIWLVRADFVFEFPRPTMPNMVYIGGFQCSEAQPLSAELEAFMQSSGEHGVVVMTLGTFVSALPIENMEAIATAFAQLPQKVVWRYLGQRPASLGNNTLLLDWLPQNDLLGHPKTRAFVAHGGTNGLYEAIYHGVPVVGLPLLFDQFDNLLRLKVRGAARVVEAASLTQENFLEALRDVLETPYYRHNMQRLSQLHRDQPHSPMDTAIFWIEYVIRNKGAAHLHSAAFSLPWYSYFSFDVALILITLSGVTIWVLVSLCGLLCCRRSRQKRKVE
ncbi:UDP-glucuronosyltransferase 2C1-like [Lampris incognitus]|uniref:UDP-glucuronosyltransferase 2C1-like n=1 Tax=Lampris incognitus TaxID=2546036 RepID=UPI0024B4ED3A|nr:UDP-glucuronosyltransferase 2C1-like [Lampris incognitus]